MPLSSFHSVPPSLPPPASRGLKFRLAPGITKANVVCYFAAAFLGLLLITLAGSLQPAVLTHLAHIPLAEQGTRQGRLVLYNEFVLLPAVLIAGVVSDRMGRRVVYAAAFLIHALVFTYLCSVSSWGMLIVASMLSALGHGGTGTMMGTVIADYTVAEDRGKGIAVMGIVVGAGAIMGALLLSRMPTWFEAAGKAPLDAVRATFLVAAAIAVFTAVLLALGLSGQRPVQHEISPGLSELARQAFRAGQDPHVLVAYLAGFVSRCDMVVLGFLTLWVNKAATNAGMGTAQAAAKAGMMFGIAQTAAWISGAFIAMLFDRMRPSRALAISLGLAGAGYVAVAFVREPLGGSMIAGACAIGVGQIASMLGSQAYVSKVAPEATRGSVMGGFGFCGAVGTLLGALTGGALFDAFDERSPFVVVGLLSAVLSFTVFVMRSRGRL